MQDTSTSFFFTRFPKSHGAKEIYDIFKIYRDIDEMVIPSRRDKNGKRCGFVRFFQVSDETSLVMKLDNIFVNDVKLFVNTPRFQRYNQASKNDEDSGGNDHGNKYNHNIHPRILMEDPKHLLRW
ncbi:unnamed protein product [Lathyrus sativus]|nr:unnamed protein product [Lathyrus sativus]